MLKQIRLHLSYIFCKNNLIVIFIGILIYMVFCLITSYINKPVDEQILYSVDFQNTYDYFVTSFSKLFITLFSSYLFSYSFIKNCNYIVILKPSKGSFYISKVISIIIVVLVMIIVFYLIYFFIGINTYWFWFSFDILIYFIRLFLVSIILGLLSLLVSTIFYNLFPFIIVYFLFMILENFIDYQFINYLYIFVPNLVLNDMNVFYSIYLLILQFIFYFILNYLLFNRLERFIS